MRNNSIDNYIILMLTRGKRVTTIPLRKSAMTVKSHNKLALGKQCPSEDFPFISHRGFSTPSSTNLESLTLLPHHVSPRKD